MGCAELSDGSIAKSLVLVPTVKTVPGAKGSEFPEFPSFIVTDTIIIRGEFETMTVCVFGTYMEEFDIWAEATEK